MTKNITDNIEILFMLTISGDLQFNVIDIRVDSVTEPIFWKGELVCHETRIGGKNLNPTNLVLIPGTCFASSRPAKHSLPY